MPPKKKAGVSKSPVSPTKLRSGRTTSVPGKFLEDQTQSGATRSDDEATRQNDGPHFQTINSAENFEKMFSMMEKLSSRMESLENRPKTPVNPPRDRSPKRKSRDRSRSEESYRSHSKKRKYRGESDTDSDSDSDSDYEDDYTIDRVFGGTIGDSIKPKLRKRILAGKFVELHELLPNYSTKKNPEFVFKTNPHSHQPTIVKNTKGSISSFGEWCEAMNVLSSVEIERAKTLEESTKLSKGLLTYRNQVQKLKNLGYDWFNFDRHFRMDMEIRRFPWETMRHDLMLQYQPRVQQSLNNTQSFRNSSLGNKGKHTHQKKQNNIPNGYCFPFHSQNNECKEGKQCKYEHKCFKCKAGVHPSYKCSQATQSR